MTTITPVVTPQQQMALAFRDFTLPEGTVLPDGSVKVWSMKVDERGQRQWVEFVARDQFSAVDSLTRLVASPEGRSH